MDILIDVNVILNYITERDDPFRESSKEIMKLCAEEEFNGYIAFHSLSIYGTHSERKLNRKEDSG
ncbi:MAG: hypothetical protein IJP41_02075 [Synergistaceae bacterium]|nr:hypothetical protein [Synergistaceae bacterium]